MQNLLRSVSVLALVLGASGCKEYFTVDEACHPEGKFRGMGNKQLQPAEVQAIDRMNCHRRLIGFQRFGVDDALQQAAENMGSYVFQNPDIYGTSNYNSLAYLTQQGARPGFTGTEIWERLDVADYQIQDATAIRNYQMIGIIPDSTVSAAKVVDDIIMRVHWGQEAVLTPSPYDVGYVEADLDPAWWAAAFADAPPEFEVPQSGKFFYLIVMSQTPPLEGAGETPVMYPKRDQTGVPVEGPWALDRFLADSNANGVLDEGDFTKLSYPISVGYTSALNPTGGTNSTPFDLVITSATITGPDGPLDTYWASPSEISPENNRLDVVTGIYSYWSGGIYAAEPFQPSTEYTVYVDVTTVDGPASHNLSFTTAAAGGTTARSVRDEAPLDLRGVRAKVSDR